MPTEDAALIAGLYEAWKAGDLERAYAAVDPDIQWSEPADAPDADTHQGAEGVEFSIARWTEPFEDFAFEVEEVRDLGGGLVLAALNQRGFVRGGNVPVEGMIFHLWSVREGRAVRNQMFRTEAEALEAAASRPPERA